MKPLLTLIACLIIISGCGKEATNIYVCNCQEKEKVRLFIENSIKNANNMSDEEMEDVVAELRKTGIQVICRQKTVIKEGGIIISGLDSTETEMNPYIY